MADPQTRHLADTHVIKRDFSRRTNMEEEDQLAVQACVVFDSDEKRANKTVGEIQADVALKQNRSWIEKLSQHRQFEQFWR